MGIVRTTLQVLVALVIVNHGASTGDFVPGVSANPRSYRASLERRNIRTTSRREIVGPNETLIGIKLPAPWETKIPTAGDPDFTIAQDVSWEVLASALQPYLRSNPRIKTGAVSLNSVESFESVPNIFRVYGLDPRAIPSLRTRSGISFVTNDPGIVFVRPNRRPGLDQLYHPSQIALENEGNNYTDLDGVTYASTKDVDIDILGAWSYTVGSDAVVVAIIDDGFDLSKPELAGNIFVNTAEIPCNGIDDDQNGFVDDYRGYDATRRTGCHKSGNSHASTFTEDSTNVPTQHGTAMALAMASLPTRVTSSIAGVAPGVLYLPIAYRGNATLDHAYAYVVAMKKAGVPIRVVNLSLGNSKPSPTQCAARAKNGQALTPLGELLSANISVVTAAGNEGTNNDVHLVCPASLAKNFDSIISVGAVDPRGQLPFYSNFGRLSVTISAPGTAIYMGYGYQTGTSIATALVSGIVALMYTADPDLTPTDVKRQIIKTAKMPELDLPTQGKGIISATNAVKSVWRGPHPGQKKKPPL